MYLLLCLCHSYSIWFPCLISVFYFVHCTCTMYSTPASLYSLQCTVPLPSVNVFPVHGHFVSVYLWQSLFAPVCSPLESVYLPHCAVPLYPFICPSVRSPRFRLLVLRSVRSPFLRLFVPSLRSPFLRLVVPVCGPLVSVYLSQRAVH